MLHVGPSTAKNNKICIITGTLLLSSYYPQDNPLSSLYIKLNVTVQLTRQKSPIIITKRQVMKKYSRISRDNLKNSRKILVRAIKIIINCKTYRQALFIVIISLQYHLDLRILSTDSKPNFLHDVIHSWIASIQKMKEMYRDKETHTILNYIPGNKMRCFIINQRNN